MIISPRSIAFGEVPRWAAPSDTPSERHSSAHSPANTRHPKHDGYLEDSRNDLSNRSSPPGEEKKSDFDNIMEQENEEPYPSIHESRSDKIPGVSSSSKGRSEIVSSSKDLLPTKGERDKSTFEEHISGRTSPFSSLRATPASVASPTSDQNDVASTADTASQLEDIAMSPLPFDREDPSTLMALPGNILSLPISPCGPNDDPMTLEA